MNDILRDRLTEEVTRKQFLQYLAGALLMVFGLNNLINLILGSQHSQKIFINQPLNGQQQHGFGSRKFGD